MPSTYRGLPGNTSGNLPATIAIHSSTPATPVQIAVLTPHGLITGDVVNIYGHQVNTVANGQFTITVTGAFTFSLNGTVGIGVGGATGTIQPLTVPSFTIPSDGDALNAASVNVAFESDADRSSWLVTNTGSWKNRVSQGLGSNLGAVRHLDNYVGATWGQIVVSSTNVQTMASGSTLPIQVTNDAVAGDLLELQLDSTANWLGSSSPSGGMFISMMFATSEPGGSLSSYAPVPAGAKWFLPGSVSTNQRIPFTLRGYVEGLAGPLVWIGVAGLVPTGGGTGEVDLLGDYFLTARLWRQTGAPQ